MGGEVVADRADANSGWCTRSLFVDKKGDVPSLLVIIEEQGRGGRWASGRSDLFHRLDLRPFRTWDHLKLHLITFIQRLEARFFNRGVVDKDIRTIVLRDKPKPFLVVKPLDGTAGHGMILLTWGVERMPPYMIGGS
jgi:hypothetical protein